MLLIKNNDIFDAYTETFKNVNKLPTLKGDPKNYKDTPATIILENYKQEKLVEISDDHFFSKFNYDRYVPGGNRLMEEEIKHYDVELFSSARVSNLINHLEKKPFSKKGVLSFWEDGYENINSIPCVVYVWFRRRESCLDMDCHMRANDAFRLLLMDLHIMTTLHSYVSEKLGLNKGKYHHFIDSLHFYKRYKKEIKNLLKQI